MSNHDAKSSRVAIQLGASSTSGPSIKQRSRPAYSKRHRAGQGIAGDSASSSGEEEERKPRHELITTYSSGDEGDHKRSRDERLPKRQRRDDRRSRSPRRNDARRHRRDRSPRRKDERTEGRSGDRDESDQKPKWGLTINMKPPGGGRDEKDSRSREERPDSKRITPRNRSRERNGNGKARTLDDEALEALVGSEPKKKKRDHDNQDPDREPQAEDYEAVPVDDFGASLLKSFGWDGKMKGKVREVTRTGNLTGLGAKNAKEAEDLGAWDQKTSKDPRPARLDDYRKEQSKRRERLEHRHRDSYKGEREREHEKNRDRHRHDR
ncbi:hypothetical protein OQA88_9238 [Cercophora sp. LCS_1]